MGWTSGDKSTLVGWAGGNGNPGANQHGWVDEKGSSQKGTAGQVVDAVAEAAKAEGKPYRIRANYRAYPYKRTVR